MFFALFQLETRSSFTQEELELAKTIIKAGVYTYEEKR
jgi:hypothetical protein